jgi:L-asparaginase II
MANPVLVEIRRGDTIESWHRGALAVLNSAGETLVELGDTNRPIYPRSAIKPLQAIPLVESGAAHRFALDDKQISLACASHGGEPMHVQAVQDWLYVAPTSRRIRRPRQRCSNKGSRRQHCTTTAPASTAVS